MPVSFVSEALPSEVRSPARPNPLALVPRPIRPRGPVVGHLAGLPHHERPREKLFSKGADALSDAELVAILLGTGGQGKPVMEISNELLAGGGLVDFFARGAEAVRSLVSGIGTAKAARLAAAQEIARRLSVAGMSGRDLFEEPEVAARFLRTLIGTETREVMGALLLDSKNRLLRNALVFQGTGTFAAVAPSPVFREAIVVGAAGVILYHNHPSGDATPSPNDKATTDRFIVAGRQIGIEIKDHIIVGRSDWTSFHKLGLLGL